MSKDDINTELKTFFVKHNIQTKDIDLIITGNNGDIEGDKIYENFMKDNFSDTPAAYFKHLTGEYHTASSFALWLGANIIKTQKYPNFIKITLEGNSFVGIRMVPDPWHSPGTEAIRGELDKDGIKKLQLMTGKGAMDAKGQISEDGNKIIIDDGEKARSILIRK